MFMKCSLPVYTHLKTDETSCLQQENGWIIKCLISVFKFKLVRRKKCLNNMTINGFSCSLKLGDSAGERYRSVLDITTEYTLNTFDSVIDAKINVTDTSNYNAILTESKAVWNSSKNSEEKAVDMTYGPFYNWVWLSWTTMFLFLRNGSRNRMKWMHDATRMSYLCYLTVW